MKWTVTLSTICVALAGCNAAGEPDGAKRFSDGAVPFTFEIPADFTKASVDDLNSKGNVVAGVGLTKVDVIAVRRFSGLIVQLGAVEATVLGHRVLSEIHHVQGDYYLECQYTPEFADKVRDACRKAVATV